MTTPSKAVQLTSVQACWRLVGESVASLPASAFRRLADGTRAEVSPEPGLLLAPSAVLAWDEWVNTYTISLMSDGNAFLLPRSGGWEWLPPSEVLVEGSWHAPRYSWNGVPFPEIRHIRGMVIPGHLRGVNPLQAAMRAVETGLEAERFGHGWFRDAPHPASILESDQPIDRTQAETIKARYMEAQKGHEPFVAGVGLKYRSLAVAPEESQFLQTQKFTVSQIARIYGVPPEMIGGESGGALTYANVEQRAIDFAQYTLRPFVVRLERVLTALLPRPQYVKLNLDSMIRADTESRYRAHGDAIRSGWKTVNEVRQLEDLPPIEGGNQALWPPFAVSAPGVATPVSQGTAL